MPTDRVHRLPQQAQPRAIRPHRPQPSTSDAATQLRHARPAPNERRYTRYVALHPLRRATPVTSRRTRYVALHPIRRGAMPTDRVHRLPQQAQPRAIRPHRPQPSTSDAATQLRHARADSAQEPLHPLRRAAPVTSRRTRYVTMHPIRRGAMPTDRVHRHLATSPIEETLVLTAPTSPNRAAADSATPLSNMPPSGSIVPSATANAWRSVLGRRTAPAYSPSASPSALEASCFARSVRTRSTTRGRRVGVSRWRLMVRNRRMRVSGETRTVSGQRVATYCTASATSRRRVELPTRTHSSASGVVRKLLTVCLCGFCPGRLV